MQWDMGQGLAQIDLRNKIVEQSQRRQDKVKAWEIASSLEPLRTLLLIIRKGQSQAILFWSIGRN